MKIFVTADQAESLDLSAFERVPYRIRLLENDEELIVGFKLEGEFKALSDQNPDEFFVEVKRDFWVSLKNKGVKNAIKSTD